MKQKQLLSQDQAVITKRQHRTPCSDCPFARTALPGWLALWNVWRWLAVIHSDARMECHTRKGRFGCFYQCAGASIFRANVIKWVKHPLLRLNQDKKRVFASNAEFVSHHERRTITQDECSTMVLKERMRLINESTSR